MGSHTKAASSSGHVEEVGRIFQQVHQSAAHAQRCKKELLKLGKGDAAQLAKDVSHVMLLILRQVSQITADAMRRHYAFLVDLCKAFREAFDSDELAIGVLKAVAPFHNAMDKAVRLAVVSTFEALLKTVDQANASEERQDFYQDVAELLKQRIHDKCPQVRAKAVTGVAAFQTGKKDCDVTQQLIALLCTDTNADVRKQILHAIAPRKEFLEGYFHGMIRCTRDVVARVRAEAWDALGRFPWRYVTAYANAKSVKLPEMLAAGLADDNASVAIACRAALTNCWVRRDSKDVCEDFLNSIACGFVLPSLLPYERISDVLLTYAQKRKSGTHFPLNLSDINTGGLFMWKADCRVSCDTAGEDETQLLPPLEQFGAILQDSVYAYARPEVEPKTVKFRNVEDADNMLRILLSVFEVYDDNAYLAHADNTTRAALLRLINFILKVVPDDDPSLFVDVAVSALKSLTARTPEEAIKTITSALDSLFRSLKLPQRHALGFDDVEAIGRKSRERQQELVKRKVMWRSGESSEEHYTELKEEMDRDEKFLLRMQLIVLAFLSHSQRGDTIPMFCYHIIQMGRHLDNEKVRVAATQSLCLQCLINPDSVHTFMPLILADAQENTNGSDMGLPIAAIGAIFDLIMEYGLRFFDTAKKSGNATDAVAATLPAARIYNPTNEVEARLLHEQELAEEDVLKVGSRRLLSTLQLFLQPGNEPKHTVTASGFCKLLSCNRVASDTVPHVISMLLIHYTGALASKDNNTTAAYMVDYLGTFFRSYSASHPKRQEQLCKGGLIAFRVVLERNNTMAMKLLEFVARLTDAYTLTLIRDIDPQTAKKACREATDEVLGTDEDANRRSSRSNTTRSSMQSGRLLRELSHYSLHERLSEGLLLDLAHNDLAESRAVCMDGLEKCMYFYSRETQPFLLHCIAKALMTLDKQKAQPLHERLLEWQSELQRRYPSMAPTEQQIGEVELQELKRRWESATIARSEQLDAMLGAGFGGIASIPPQITPVATGVKSETMELKRERDSDYFDVESIVGSRKRTRY